jgi:O-acetyl-ADP-ribose deacetylase (regulator of RNase III)
MIIFTSGNLLEANAEALVNTVNTVGVMGKGIALMFKERFPYNYKAYLAAAKAGDIHVGQMFIVEVNQLGGPRWIVNFPTKKHWRPPSRIEWIEAGLEDLRRFLIENKVKSVAIPPLGAGNGGLDWAEVRTRIEAALSTLDGVDVFVFVPTPKYQNVAKRHGVDRLTPARALIAELVRRYWVLGMECSLLEVQKLAWFLERSIEHLAPDNPLDLRFEANKYGPYADRLRHLLNGLDGSYLHCDRRISDAEPMDVINFEDSHNDFLQLYLKGDEFKPYRAALDHTAALIAGFESPYGMELLATVDWLLSKEDCEPSVTGIQKGIQNWPAGSAAAARKSRIFSERDIRIALERLTSQQTQA